MKAEQLIGIAIGAPIGMYINWRIVQALAENQQMAVQIFGGLVSLAVIGLILRASR